MDINKIREQLGKFKSSSSSSNILWKPQSGKSQIRIVEYKYDKSNPFVQMFFYFDIFSKPILSPLSYGEPDPIDEFASKLYRTGSEKDKELAKKLRPKVQFLVPIVVRGQESEGVKVWSFGPQVANELKNIIEDPDYGDITDVMKGHDITIEKLTPKEAGNQFGKTGIRAKPNKTPLHTDASVVQKLLEDQPNISEVFTKYTYEELKDMLKSYLNPTPKTDSDAQVDELFPNPEPASATLQKSSRVANVQEAFDDIFDKI